jgi:hypothetical protein
VRITIKNNKRIQKQGIKCLSVPAVLQDTVICHIDTPTHSQ